MDGDDAQAHFLKRPEAWLDFPFGLGVYVFKVRSKMFGTLGWEEDVPRINLKCEPNQALMLRDVFESVLPGYHMNKAHWNTVLLDGSVPTGEVERMIEHSYALVVKKLPKKERISLEVAHSKEVLYAAL